MSGENRPRLCVDCKHFRGSLDGETLCGRSEVHKLDLVTGDPALFGRKDCYREREGGFRGACGNEARYFEEMD